MQINTQSSPVKYSFGSTSAIITNLAVITGFDATATPKIGIIGSLLVIAFADNISDALGIHIYQEAEGLKEKSAWRLTLTNFIARLIISLGFVLIMAFLPANTAVVVSILYGLTVLAIISYIISVKRGKKPLAEICEHLTFAIGVIILSKYFGSFILHQFKNV